MDSATWGQVAGDDGGLAAHGGGDDDRVLAGGGARGGTGDAEGAADVLIVGEDVAAL